MQTMQLSNRVAGGKVFAAPRRAVPSLPTRNVVRRFQDDKPGANSRMGTKLSDEQLREIEAKQVGDLSPSTAEKRADLGNSWVDANEIQAFDGPAPETINGRAAMLGVIVGLIGEWTTGLGLKQQIADHPLIVLSSFVIIALATYAPISKGYTRKEPFQTGFWNVKAENWNGRVAMLGFTAMILTEAIGHCNTFQFWHLQ